MKDDQEAFDGCFKERLKTMNEAAKLAGEQVKEEIGKAPSSHFAARSLLPVQPLSPTIVFVANECVNSLE